MMTGLSWLLERFAEFPERTAFIHDDRVVSYGDLCRLVDGFGEKLADAGVRPGERVVVLGDYTPEAYALVLALAMNANITIPFTRESVVEQSTALAVCGSDWMFEFMDGSILPELRECKVACDNALINQFVDESKAGIVLFSSGSTGKPKGILHDFERVASKFRKQRTPVVAIPFLMFDHFGGLNTILAISASLGTVVSVKQRSVDQICRAIEKYRVTLLPTTPSFINLVLASKSEKQYDLSSLERVTYGTEVMSQATLDRLREALPGVVLQQTYGLSEVGVLASKSRGDGSLWMRLGGEGFQTKIVDDILWIKSDFAMAGYLNAPSGFDDDGWFNTQDRVEVDGDYFRVLGRVTDLINIGGQKVYPSEIEDVIMTIPNIVDVAVSSEDNALLGKIIVARVVLQEPEPEHLLKSRVRIACKDKIAAFKIPSKVIVAETGVYTSRFKKSRK